jgi:hypothetical protein
MPFAQDPTLIAPEPTVLILDSYSSTESVGRGTSCIRSVDISS